MIGAPALYQATEPAEGRQLMWLEDVSAIDPADWNAGTYARARRHPLLSSAALHRLRAGLARALPVMLDRLDARPLPQNPLAARQSPETFVAIDIAFRCPPAIGFAPAGLHDVILTAFPPGGCATTTWP